jgi:hypothetical protein
LARADDAYNKRRRGYPGAEQDRRGLLRTVHENQAASFPTSCSRIADPDGDTRLRKTTYKLKNLAFVDVSGRIAHTLMDLSKQPDAMTHPDGMQIKITRQELGKIAGARVKWRDGYSKLSKKKAWCRSRARPWWS